MLPYLQRRGAGVVRAAIRTDGSFFLSSNYYYYVRVFSSSFATDFKPVVCHSLSQCQERAQVLLQDILVSSFSTNFGGSLVERRGHGGARTLSELQELSEHFVATLHSALFLPRDVVHKLDDFPIFLLRYYQHSSNRTSHQGFMNEEGVVNDFVDWMDMVLSATSVSCKEEALVSFVELMRLVQSFVRYHNGVRWGGWSTRGEWHRGAYLLHPWHGTYCPASHAEQMPYVHLLQWLLRHRPTGQETARSADGTYRGDVSNAHELPGDDAMRWWNATERFFPPSWRTNNGKVRNDSWGFSAIDCGCHSGYMADLLLRAGARCVLGVDVSVQALGSAEATIREHLREKRSTACEAKTLQLIRCDLLPEVVPTTQSEGGITSEKGSVMAAAAARRRCAARQHSLLSEPEISAAEKEVIGPFDFLVFHPPIKPLFPMWPLLEETMGYVDHSALGAGIGHPHSELAVLRELLQQLLFYSGNDTDLTREQRRPKASLLKDNGYVAFILPLAFDPKILLQHTSSLLSSGLSRGDSDRKAAFIMSLSDLVIRTLEGPYELILRRRHSPAGAGNVVEKMPRSYMKFMSALAHPQCCERIQREMDAFYRVHQTVDLVVLRKKPNTRNEKDSNLADVREKGDGSNNLERSLLTYDDSFEYVEYIPAEGPQLRHHWTELTPSYSYLEDDFFGGNTASAPATLPERNFLAVGHPMSVNRKQQPQNDAKSDDKWTQAEVHKAQRNLHNYRNLFAEELKRKRGGRLRKMALQPLEKQEWYINEKLVKSEAAKVDLFNELARFDMKDWD